MIYNNNLREKKTEKLMNHNPHNMSSYLALKSDINMPSSFPPPLKNSSLSKLYQNTYPRLKPISTTCSEPLNKQRGHPWVKNNCFQKVLGFGWDYFKIQEITFWNMTLITSCTAHARLFSMNRGCKKCAKGVHELCTEFQVSNTKTRYVLGVGNKFT